ncbi:hypothetical protein BGW41_007007 [Actinomortierella wolfii]|nr:hypothetical protein BGW41_007007 [Actinomortierella wolfii]
MEGLPLECVEHIVSYIEDLATIYSLLTVNRQFFHISCRILYRNPLYAAWKWSDKNGTLGFAKRLQALFDFILEFSSSTNANVEYLRRRRGIKQWRYSFPISNTTSTNSNNQDSPNTPTLDYLNLIEIFDYPDTRWSSTDPILSHPSTSAIEKELQLDAPQLRTFIKHTITWAACAHHFETIRELYIPTCKIGPYSNVIPQLSNLRVVTFDYLVDDYGQDLTFDENGELGRNVSTITSETNDNDGGEQHFIGYEQKQKESYLASLEFVKAFTAHHGVSLLQDCRAYRQYDDPSEDIFQQIQNLLPPLRHPNELTLANWHRFIKWAEITDLSHVVDIELLCRNKYEPLRNFLEAWPEKTVSSVLSRCRRLRSIEMDKVHEPELFHWAAIERTNQLQHLSYNDTNNTGMPTLQHPPLTLPPLKKIDISCSVGAFKQLIHDAVAAFAPTLECLVVEGIFAMNLESTEPIRLGPVGSSVWQFPRLKTLYFGYSDGPIVLERSALDQCPLLEKLHIEAIPSSHYSLEDLQPTFMNTWHMAHLTTLDLRGPTAWDFCPKSFQYMPSLLTLTLESTADTSTSAYNQGHIESHQQEASWINSTIQRKRQVWLQILESESNDFQLSCLKEATFISDMAVLVDLSNFIRRCPRLHNLTLNSRRVASQLMPLQMQIQARGNGSKIGVNATTVENDTAESHFSQRLHLYIRGFHITDEQIDVIPLLGHISGGRHYVERLFLRRSAGFSASRLAEACEKSEYIMEVTTSHILLADEDAKRIGLARRHCSEGDFGLTRPNSGRRYCWYHFGSDDFIRCRPELE